MGDLIEVKVPDIGDFHNVDVIEVLAKPGAAIKKDDALIALESDKATMEVPAPQAGVVKELKVKVGDKVSEGSLILLLEAQAEAPAVEPKPRAAPEPTPQPAAGSMPEARRPVREATPPAPPPPHRAPPVTPAPEAVTATAAHASPKVRRFARELGVALDQVKGGGLGGRILKEDVQAYVKQVLSTAGGPAGPGRGAALAEIPEIDFSQFGPVETQPLSRIKKLSGPNLHRNWLAVPHVTQHDEADITELEAFRKALMDEAATRGVRLNLLAFLLKACVAALTKYPEFNSSLDRTGENLILKRYYHIGVAVDTLDGLVVPVLRDVDKKGVFDLARELDEASARAREKKLSPSDMQGGCFSISSLGGISGTGFTPIINAPEVAILGVSKAVWKPVARDGETAIRLMLPLSLSYDHRVIDGAAAARFTQFLSAVLADARRLVL